MPAEVSYDDKGKQDGTHPAIVERLLNKRGKGAVRFEGHIFGGAHKVTHHGERAAKDLVVIKEDGEMH